MLVPLNYFRNFCTWSIHSRQFENVDAPPGAKGSRHGSARKSQRARRKATTFFKPGRHDEINRVHASNSRPCKKFRVKYSYIKVMSDPDQLAGKKRARFKLNSRTGSGREWTEWGIPKQGNTIVHGY